jgi:hypothetical protein
MSSQVSVLEIERGGCVVCWSVGVFGILLVSIDRGEEVLYL